MYSVSSLSLQFSGVPLFSDISFIINKRDRIGLAGKNGAGKTTLLRILTGMQEADSGSVSKPSGSTTGFLPQEVSFAGTQSVFNETLNAFEKIIALRKTIAACEHELSLLSDYDSDIYTRLVQKLTEAGEQYALWDGHNTDAETEKILLGLGFTPQQLHMPVSSFSGGWRMRVELAKILLQRPDLLLLDEPTNHLDIESIQWLEDYLSRYPGAVVVVSHDRTFLDNVTHRTIEINMGRIYDYDVPYSEYLIKRQERITQQTAEYENQQKFIEHTEKFIERFRYKATKASQVQSRIKMLDKLDRIEVDETDNSSIFFRFPPAPASGKVVVEAESLNKNYGSKEVLKNLDFIIDKGDKIAFVGKNGEGKTTLSRIIVGDLDYMGQCKMGYNVSLGYYAQNETELLNPEKTVFETIDDVAVGDIRPKIRNILGSFLFGGDTIEKKVKVLSGGEKSRLALAKLLLKPINLLVLDEPTNHLDMRAKDILKQALMAYNGTLIIVSHDRYFLQGLTNKVFEFRNKGIRQYIGDVNEFLKSRRIENLRTLELPKITTADAPARKAVPQQQAQREKNKAIDRDIRKTENNITAIEKTVEKTEIRLKEIETVLENPAGNLSHDMYNALSEEYKTLKSEHDKLVEEWTSHHEILDSLSKQKQS